MAQKPEIYFYLPECDLETVPSRIEDYWEWQTATEGLSPWWGVYHWVLQTFLYLRQAGFPCRLTNNLPDDGILISHRDYLGLNLWPKKNLVVVCLLVDRPIPHPYAHFHVVHRAGQNAGFAHRSRHLPPWPQVSLMPRDPARGNRFETVGYFGYEVNLVDELRSDQFRMDLKELGLNFYVPPPSEWNDFRNIDAVVGIRSFGRKKYYGKIRWPISTKPALKLVNAWHAGTPAILGYEPGYRSVRRSDLDFIEANTYDDVLAGLGILAESPALRRQMRENGFERAKEFTPEAIIGQWIKLLSDEVIPYYYAWKANNLHRMAFRAEREIVRTGRRIRAILHSRSE
jgi:hypothetical protein